MTTTRLTPEENEGRWATLAERDELPIATRDNMNLHAQYGLVCVDGDGDEWSATSRDYWQYAADSPIHGEDGEPMRLAVKRTILVAP
jgi:hypothetical protein